MASSVEEKISIMLEGDRILINRASQKNHVIARTEIPALDGTYLRHQIGGSTTIGLKYGARLRLE